MDYTKGQPEAKESSVRLGMSCQKRYCRKPDPAPPPPEPEAPDERTHHALAVRHAEQIVNQVLSKAEDDYEWAVDLKASSSK